VLNQLLVVQHPDKTVVCRISRGFDFRGYWFSPWGITIAGKSYERLFWQAARLYEQGADVFSIELYLRRAMGWFVCGLSRIPLFHDLVALCHFFLLSHGAHWLLFVLFPNRYPFSDGLSPSHDQSERFMHTIRNYRAQV